MSKVKVKFMNGNNQPPTKVNHLIDRSHNCKKGP